MKLLTYNHEHALDQMPERVVGRAYRNAIFTINVSDFSKYYENVFLVEETNFGRSIISFLHER